jgi:methylenetetrahydrofolate dehydrogenase (NADP+) / methenyltetrahydrofolate cyclohydrolase
MNVAVLDGSRLSVQRRAAIASSAADVLLRRGQPPALLLVAFEDAQGRVPHVARKMRESRELGIHTALLAIAPDQSTADVSAVMRRAMAEHEPDAVFVQVPIPDGLDSDAIVSEIPPHLDVDVMSPVRVAGYIDSAAELPPVTITAAMTLLDAYDVRTAARYGVVIADESPFARMFQEALIRRGTHSVELISPSDAELHQLTRRAGLVVAAAGIPWLLKSSELSPGTVALDIGYFNGGGRGDIEVDGIDHLAAIMPVPGGVGPMTVSALLERVVDFAACKSS